MNVTGIQPKVNAADIPLERLAGNASVTQQQKVEEAGRQFEAAMLRQILSEAQKTTFKSKYAGDNSTASSIYRDMTVTQLADSISRSGGLGLAKVLNKELTKQLPST
jgi:flagellar protein FlgJ